MPPLLSICITCMNRESQLKQCLKENMIKLSPFTSSELEIVLVHFLHPEKKRENDRIDTWVRRTFPRFIRSGVLQYYVTDRLVSWHASIAKNTSHRLANGIFVVNMDCDNKIDPREVYYLLDLIKGATKNSYRQKISKNVGGHFIYHGWSGKFHDGTYGRIGMFQEDFKQLGGYDESFLPMGSQDMDLLTRATYFYKSYAKIGPRYNSIAIGNTKTESLDNVNFIFINPNNTINQPNNSKNNTRDNVIEGDEVDFNTWIPSSLDKVSSSKDISKSDNVKPVKDVVEDDVDRCDPENITHTLEKITHNPVDDNYQIESNIDFMLPTGISTPTINLPLSRIEDNNTTSNPESISDHINYPNICITDTTSINNDSQDDWGSVRNILNQTVDQINQLDTLFKNSDLSFQPLPEFDYNESNSDNNIINKENSEYSRGTIERVNGDQGENMIKDRGENGGGEGSDGSGEGGEGGKGGEGGEGGEASGTQNKGKNYPTWVDRPTHIPYTTPSRYECNNLERLKKEIENNSKGDNTNSSWKRMEGINRRRIYQKVETNNFIITPPHMGVSVMKILVDHLTMEYSEMVNIVSIYLQSQTRVEPVIYMGDSMSS